MMKVVRITAMWCMSCLVMKPRYDDVFATFGIDDVKDYDYDIDDVESYQPGEILPVVIFYDEQKEIGRVIGEHSKKSLKQLIAKQIKK